MTQSVAIIIPVRNEAAHLNTSMAAVLRQNYPPDSIEILIADGMSTDGTRAVIEGFAARFPQRRILILDNPSKIASTGLNIALSRAKGGVIARVDAHTVISFDYVQQCVEALRRSGADNVGGKMTAVGRNAFGRAVALATSSPFGVGGGRFHYSDEEETVDTVYLGAWPRAVFERIGLFDEELVRDQDDEFNYRLREAGGKILLSPKIKSEYTVRGSPFALWRQYFQYGYWKVRVLQKHPRQMQLRQFVPPFFVIGLLAPLVLGSWVPAARDISLLVASSYVAANLCASIVTAARKGWEHLPLLPVTFAILHLGYGLGFLIGLVRFWNRWGDRRGKVPEWKPGELRTSA